MRGLLDNAGAAEFLGVSVNELKRLRLQRLVPHVRLSYKKLRYRPIDLEAYIERNRVPAVWERSNKLRNEGAK